MVSPMRTHRPYPSATISIQFAMPMPFDFRHPYTSTRLPLFARNVVSTSHPLAAQAGLQMLQRGGNAVDAAIAAAATITLTEPVSNGLGSDAFCILWDGQKLHGLNASGTAPAAWTPQYFQRKYGDATATPEQYVTAVNSRNVYQNVLTSAGLDEIVTEIKSAEGVPYYLAEEYHQKYLQKNPNGYDCHSSTGIAYPSAGIHA